MTTSLPVFFDKLSRQNGQSLDTHWRDILLRDIEHLLNDAARSADLKLVSHQQCDSSVLNYGLPSLSQRLPINTDPQLLARHIQRILATFEPRLDPRSIKVIPVVDSEQTWVLAILFDIHARCLLFADEQFVNLRIALDYSYGAVEVF